MLSSINQIKQQNNLQKCSNKGISYTQMQMKYPVDTVSFTSKPETQEKKETLTEKKEHILLKIAKCIFNLITKILAAIFLPAPSKEKLLNNFINEFATKGKGQLDIAQIELIVDPFSPPLILDVKENKLKLNLDKFNNKSCVDKTIADAKILIECAKKHNAFTQKVINEACKEYGIEKEFVPTNIFAYNESLNLGQYRLDEHNFLINAYWLEKAKEPELLISEIASHELSHAKSNLDFSLIDQDDIPNKLRKKPVPNIHLAIYENAQHYKNYREFREKTSPISKDSTEYKRILHHLLRNLEDYNMSKSDTEAFGKNNDILTKMVGEIAKVSGLTLLEANTINLPLYYMEGKIESQNASNMDKALFDDKDIQRINEKIQENFNRIEIILKAHKYAFANTFKYSIKYTDIFDEALARNNSSIIMQKLLTASVLDDTIQTREAVEENMTDVRNLVFKTDPEVREMIEAGMVKTSQGKEPFKLDDNTLKFIADHNGYFKLDLTKQMKMR